MKNVILIVGGIGVGVGIAVYLAKKKPALFDSIGTKINDLTTNKPKEEVIQVGAENKSMLAFQKNMNVLFPELALKEDGIYSPEMQRKIYPILAPASYAFDTASGELKPYFVENFNYVVAQQYDLPMPEKPTTKAPKNVRFIEKGGKSKEVERLQLILREYAEMPDLAKVDLGAYTRETGDIANIVFNGTTCLLDKTMARIDADFINAFYTITKQKKRYTMKKPMFSKDKILGILGKKPKNTYKNKLKLKLKEKFNNANSDYHNWEDYDEEVIDADTVLADVGVSQDQADKWASQDSGDINKQPGGGFMGFIENTGKLINFGFTSVDKYNFYKQGGTTMNGGTMTNHNSGNNNEDDDPKDNTMLIVAAVGVIGLLVVLVATNNSK